MEDEFAKLRCGQDEISIRAALRGIFLRIELSQLATRMNLSDRVLYTDCDVFFPNEVVAEFAAVDCRYFAVAPEFDKGNYLSMNTGVMWMNLPGLRTVDEEFRSFVRQNLPRLQSVAWDQGAYREFFAREGNSFAWDKLRPELNWKPYWGDYAAAKIVHFHGPKPFQRSYVESIPALKHLTGGCYDELCEQWADLLAEVE